MSGSLVLEFCCGKGHKDGFYCFYGQKVFIFLLAKSAVNFMIWALPLSCSQWSIVRLIYHCLQ